MEFKIIKISVDMIFLGEMVRVKDLEDGKFTCKLGKIRKRLWFIFFLYMYVLFFIKFFFKIIFVLIFFLGE